jgi:O-antigen/teichoic acid export membrane protein
MFKTAYSTKVNVVANFIGTIWIALLNIVFVPIYLTYLGIEAYGLIGVFLSIQVLIGLLDFGISPSVNRELARLSAMPDKSQDMRDLKRTLEIPNWVTATIIGLGLAALSPLLAAYWIQPKDLTLQAVTTALLIGSVNIAIQFSANFYIGGLLGLQKQLLMNVINVFCASLRCVGALVVLAYFSATIQAFLLWQGAVACLQVVMFAITLNHSLPDSPKKGVFRRDLFGQVWKFAAGMTGVGVAALLLTQLDKVILSRMLTLENFGYYTLAGTIAGTVLSASIGGITHAVYPQFSRLVAVGNEQELSSYYHKSCQIVSVILIPTVAVLAIFSYEILFLWTKNAETSGYTSLLLTLISIGTGLNCLLWLPYFLQLAYGWTKLALYMNLGAIIVLIPVMIWGIYTYGAAGAAGTWVILNASYIVIEIQIMHRRILKGEQWRWYFNDVAIALLISVVTLGISFWLFPAHMSRLITAIWLAASWGVAVVVSVLAYPSTRSMALQYVAAARSRFA